MPIKCQSGKIRPDKSTFDLSYELTDRFDFSDLTQGVPA